MQAFVWKNGLVRTVDIVRCYLSPEELISTLASQLYAQIHTRYGSEAVGGLLYVEFEDFDAASVPQLRQLNPDDLDMVANTVTEGLAYLGRELIVVFDRGWNHFRICPVDLVPDPRQSGFDS